jgi:hypothetical protein
MTTALYRRKAEECRRLAAERPGTPSASYLFEQAENHDRAAALLVELRKINAALPPVARRLARRCETLH